MGCNIFAANERLHLQAQLKIIGSELLWFLSIEIIGENGSISGGNST
jgi:hypothetical protein